MLFLDSAGHGQVVVKFTASWCGPCKKIQPALDALAVAEDANVVFVSVDVEAAAEAGWECGIDALPTFRFIRDGIQLEQFATPLIDKVVEGVKNFK